MRIFKTFAYFNGLSRITLRNGLAEVKYINQMARPISTIDTKDVAYHSSFKNVWWDEVALRPLHAFNPIRVQFVRDGLANTGFKCQSSSLPLQGVKIADVGCGGGILTECLARVGAQVTGIDASADLINTAKEHIKLDSDILERVDYVQTTIEEFSQKNEDLYDAVVASEVLEHVDNSNLFLKECVKILKPGGSLFITTPNKTLASWFLGIIVAEYIINIIPRGIHEWNKFIPPHETQRILDSYGCKTKLIHGLIYNPMTYKWSWLSSTRLCYALHAVKKTGV